MILVAGSTGVVGGLVSRRLAGSGVAVRAIVRSTTDPAKRDVLAAAGVDVVEGNLQATRPPQPPTHASSGWGEAPLAFPATAGGTR